MRAVRWAAICLTASASLATHASPAFAAPSKSECIDANTQGQTLRRNGQLRAARTELQTCVAQSCPAIVRGDCQSRLDDIERAMPSFVLHATDKLAVVSVTMDGEPLTNGFEQPFEVDPGEHHFVFRKEGRAPSLRVISIDEGVKARAVDVKFEEPVVHAVPPSNGLRLSGIAFSAAGLAGIAVGVGFGVAGLSTWGDVKSECLSAPVCDYSKAVPDRARTLDFATVSDVAFVIGGALAVAGAVLLTLNARARPAAATPSSRLGVIGLSGVF